MSDTNAKRGRGRPKKENRQNLPFVKRLQQLMSDKTQVEIANKTGIARQTIGQFLTGNTSPDAETLCKLADVFDVSVDYLLGRTDINPQDMNVSICADFLGITEETAKKLKEICCDENGKRKDFAISIGCFIQSPEFCKLVECIEMVNSTSFDLYKKFINEYERDSLSENDIEKIDSCRYKAHKTLEEILDSADNRTFNQQKMQEIAEYISEKNKNCSE